MKNLIYFLSSMLFFFACSQGEENLTVPQDTNNVSTLPTPEAQLKFARILSQAVSGSKEVRSFLKKEALAQFDNDYDVFYPLVKDKIVTGNLSFRDILLTYCPKEKELIQIEQSLPLLNIMVPDLTLFWDFNAKSWDVEDKEVAVLCRDDKSNTVYENGENIGSLPQGEIPGFPCMVIKNNERMKITGSSTRTGDITYEFAHEAFDGSKQILTRHSNYDQDLEVTDKENENVKQEDIMPAVIKAWEELKDVPNAYQRDYIYYGITRANTRGALNENIREKLYRFLINANAFSKISNAGTDPTLQNVSQEKRTLTDEEIIQRIWTDGKFEFRFKSYLVDRENNKTAECVLAFSVAPQEAFSIKKANVQHKNSTAFRHSKNTYSVKLDDLRSKWIYPERLGLNANNTVFVLPWNIYNKALTIILFAEEVDGNQTERKTKTIYSEFANPEDFAMEENENGPSIPMKLGYGLSYTIPNTTNITTTIDADPLGILMFHFYDPIIRNKSNRSYQLLNVSSGDFIATLLPIEIEPAK